MGVSTGTGMDFSIGKMGLPLNIKMANGNGIYLGSCIGMVSLPKYLGHVKLNIEIGINMENYIAKTDRHGLMGMATMHTSLMVRS